MARRKELGERDELRREPMAIYEVHLPSWMRGQDGRYLSKLAHAPIAVQPSSEEAQLATRHSSLQCIH